MIPHSWRRPLLALVFGLACAALARAFAASSQAPALARDLAAATGFPVDTTTDIPGPWGLGILAMATTWTVWVCLETRSFAIQCLLLAAALGLCLTGSWLARLGGGEFPTVPTMVGLFLAFVAGQFAAGFGGGPRADALRGLLDGSLDRAVLARLVAGPEPSASLEKPMVVTQVQCPEEDSPWLGTLREGLMADRAWVRDQGDGRLLVIHGLWEETLDAPAALASLARAVESLATRPPGWKLATAIGMVTRRLQLDPPAALHVRGAILTRTAAWLDADESPADGLPIWLVDPAGPGEVPGWSPGQNLTTPARLRPITA